MAKKLNQGLRSKFGSSILVKTEWPNTPRRRAMPDRSISFYLRLALWLAVGSVVLSAVTLILGAAPFGPLAAPEDAYIDHISKIATLSAAISSIFALMIGAIAIIAVIVAEKAETRSIEQLKIDISKLWMVLHTIRNRGILYTSPDLVRSDLDIFASERAALHEVINSPSGFSLYIWQAKHSSRGLENLTIDIAGLSNLLTLGIEEDRLALFNEIAIRANRISESLSVLGDQDISDMAAIVQKLGSGLDQAKDLAQADSFGALIRDMDSSWKKNLKRPSQADIDQMAAAAQMSIGGQSGNMIKQFGAKALSGDENDVATWYKLLTKLNIDGAAQPSASNSDDG